MLEELSSSTNRSDPTVRAAERLFLVTGASGFVGNALCRALAPNGRVRALSRRRHAGPWDDVMVADLAADPPLDTRSLDGVETVFHLAGLAHDAGRAADEEEHRRVNVEGTRRLIDACEAVGVRRLVFLSSVKAGAAEDGVAGKERSPYARSKREAESLVLSSRVPHRCVIRSALVYGPGVKGNIARMIRAVERGVFPPLPRLQNRRSLVHVADLAEALVLAAERPEASGETFTVTDGRAYSTREIYDWIREALGRPAPRWRTPLFCLRGLARAGDALGVVSRRPPPFDSNALEKLTGSEHYDSSRIAAMLGFAPRRNLRDSMREMVAAARPRERL